MFIVTLGDENPPGLVSTKQRPKGNSRIKTESESVPKDLHKTYGRGNEKRGGLFMVPD